MAELRAEPHRVGSSKDEKRVEAKLINLCYREEVMWRQRSRVQWLAEADSNTKFFIRRPGRGGVRTE